MRNLKRVLSLALASVMLLGMMVIGAGAADYTDTDSISQKEAAQVMEAIGVMQGNDKGEFLPTADLTREAAAKIITYLLLGKSSADALTAVKAPYNDVEAGRWSAGSIAYCQVNGIISGDGKGNFFPTNTVTGTQFAKMLLGALGYNAETEKYVGPGYELNIAKQVSLLKLNDGISTSLPANLTREDAARMALNTLNQSLVEYTGGINVTLEGGSVQSGGTRQSTENSFMSIYQPSLSYAAGTNGGFDRPSHKWAVGKTAIGTYADEAAQTYTVAARADAIASDLAGYTRVDTTPISVNGTSGTIDATDSKELAKLTGAGRVVEFYTTKVAATDSATAYYKVKQIVVVDTLLAKISSINTVTKDAMITLQSATTVPGVGAPTVFIKQSENKDMYNKLAEMKADDYVLVQFDEGKLVSIEVPETVTGTYTSYSKADGKRTIAGTTYDTTYGSADKLNNGDSKMVIGSDYVAYLDTYGNVIYATADTVAATKTAYVTNVERTGNVSIDGNYTYNAMLLFTDGTQQWVKVTSYNGDPVKSTDNTVNDAFSDKKTLKGDFVTYSVRADGSYAISQINDGKATSLPATITTDEAGKANDANTFSSSKVYTFGGTAIVKDKVNFMGAGYNVMGSGKTVFLVKTGDTTYTYRTYTGITNIAGWDASVSGKMVVGKGTSAASIVIIDTGVTTDVKDYVYILSSDYDATYVDGDVVYTYNAIVNGKVTTLQSTKTVADKGLYQAAAYAGDYVSKLVPAGTNSNASKDYIYATVSGTSDAKGVISYSNGTVITKNVAGSEAVAANYVTTNDVAVIAVSASGSASPISAGDLNLYKNIAEYVLVMDRTGFVSTVIFVYGDQ